MPKTDKKKQKAKRKASKKITKRSRTPFPGLSPGVNGKKRQEYMDEDYSSKLSIKEKQWLSDFMEHWLSGSMKKGCKKFGKTKKERLAAFDRNNARNRCILSEARALGRVTEIDALEVDKMQRGTEHNAEDIIIARLDNPEDPNDESIEE